VHTEGFGTRSSLRAAEDTSLATKPVISEGAPPPSTTSQRCGGREQAHAWRSPHSCGRHGCDPDGECAPPTRQNQSGSPIFSDWPKNPAHDTFCLKAPGPCTLPRRLERSWPEKANQRVPTCASRVAIIASSSMVLGTARERVAIIQIIVRTNGRLLLTKGQNRLPGFSRESAEGET